MSTAATKSWKHFMATAESALLAWSATSPGLLLPPYKKKDDADRSKVGCDVSHQEESAKQCQVCKTCWFCSQGCMVAAGHVPCPHNKEYESKANFK